MYVQMLGIDMQHNYKEYNYDNYDGLARAINCNWKAAEII